MTFEPIEQQFIQQAKAKRVIRHFRVEWPIKVLLEGQVQTLVRGDVLSFDDRFELAHDETDNIYVVQLKRGNEVLEG